MVNFINKHQINPPKQGYRFSQYPSNLSYIFSLPNVLSDVDDTLLFSLFEGDSGYSNLPQSITLNGVSVSPNFIYEGKNANASTWTATAGSNLSVIGTTPTLTASFSSPFTNLTDTSVKFSASAGQSFRATGDLNLGQIGTDDFVFEMVFRKGSGTNTVAATATAQSSQPGWWIPNSTVIQFNCRDTNGGTGGTGNISGLVADNWYHVIVFANRNTGMRSYLNGVLATNTITITSCTGSIVSPTALTIGDLSGVGTTVNGDTCAAAIAYCGLWKQADWLADATFGREELDLAKERFARVCGLYPSLARGTATPGIMTRATTANLDIINPSTDVRSLYLVGSNWMRFVSRKTALSGAYEKGFLSEQQSTNLLTQSQTFDNAAAWSLLNAVVDANDMFSPDGGLTADGLIGSGGNGSHLISQNTTFSSLVPHTLSVFAKRGASNFLGLYTTSINNGVMFNLLSGTVGNRYDVLDQVTGTIEDYGNDWYRCALTWTAIAGTFTSRFYASRANWTANGSNTQEYVGDGATIDTYLWGAQLEAQALPTSYIATTTGFGTRNKDDLIYSGSENTTSEKGTLLIKSLSPNISGMRIGAISDGNNNSILFNSNAFQVAVTYTSGGVSQGTVNTYSFSNFQNGEEHEARVVYETNNLQIFVDNLSSSIDTSISTIPNGTATRLAVGNSGASSTGGQVGQIITKVKAWNEVVTSGSGQ